MRKGRKRASSARLTAARQPEVGRSAAIFGCDIPFDESEDEAGEYRRRPGFEPPTDGLPLRDGTVDEPG
jgi:hypothetical protein